MQIHIETSRIVMSLIELKNHITFQANIRQDSFFSLLDGYYMPTKEAGAGIVLTTTLVRWGPEDHHFRIQEPR